MTDFVTVMTTIDSEVDAAALARALVERKLAACVQRLPVASCYEWQGEVRDELEFLLIVKTRRALYGELEAVIRELHSYATPEIVCLDIAAGSKPYLDWIAAVTR